MSSSYDMSPIEYLKEILAVLPQIAEQTGYSTASLALSFAKTYLLYRVQIDEFRTLHLYDYSTNMQARFLTWRYSKAMADALDAGAAPEEFAVFNDKHLFNQYFRDFIHREWLYLPDASPEDVAAFLSKNPVFLVKACTGTQGEGISCLESAGTSAQTLKAQYSGQPVILESFIQQHPVMAELNPSSVNTVRIIAARKGDMVQLIGVGLRSGGGGQFVDNFHHGGTAYPLDMETGIVTAPGKDLDGNDVLRHPVSGRIMPGFQVPHWDNLLEQVHRASVMAPPHIGYVGWDIAITPDGVEFIEGNIKYPGNNIIQLDGPGPYARLQDFMQRTSIRKA